MELDKYKLKSLLCSSANLYSSLYITESQFNYLYITNHNISLVLLMG